jgi:hypothetical protein
MNDMFKLGALTYDGRMPIDGKNSHGLWPGELKRGKYEVVTRYGHFWAIFGYV